MRAGWSGEPVVHPLALAPGRDDARLPQVSKMPGNLGLRRADYFREITDTYFLPGHQIEKSQAGRVCQSSKELIQRRSAFHSHSLAKYIRLDECVRAMIP